MRRLLLLLLLGLAVCPSCSRARSRPNVLLISIDTLRADRVSYAGYERATTPNLDRLARDAFRFSDVIAQAPSTPASHKSIFTSLFPSFHRQTQRRTSVSVDFSLASILRSDGYHTAGFADGGFLSARFGFGHGFDLYDDGGGEGSRMGVGRLGLAGINPKVRRWLAERPQKPFFLFVHTYDVHCPYTPPEPYFSKFSSWYRGSLQVQGACGSTHFQHLSLDSDDFRYISDLYDGGIAYMDHHLGELFEMMRDARLMEEMIVIVTSDHGESLGERGHVGHNQRYDEQLRVPLVWRIPGESGQEVAEPAQSVDILPTLCELLRIEPRTDFQGRSLLSHMRGRDTFGGRRMRLSEGHFGHALRFDRRYKLVIGQDEESLLFDIDADPLELTPVAAAEQARLMRQDWAAWVKQNRPLSRKYAKTRAVETDPETERQLEALGYVGAQ